MRRPSTSLKRSLQVRRIVALFSRANPVELEEGLDWYATANTFARGLSKKYAISLEQAAGVIAALSPQVSWEQNQVIAETFCRLRKVRSQTRANQDKARAILEGTPVLEVLGKHERTGKKVRAFFACIAAPDRTEKVCVDRHAFALAEGLLYDDEQNRNNLLKRNGVYEALESAYCEAARILGVRPHQAQAVTWVVWRNLKREVNAPELEAA